MENLTIAGRNTKNGELKRLQDGRAVLSWSVAVNGRGKGQEITRFYDISLFGKRAESLAEHIRKGDNIAVSGAFSTREYEGKTYLQIAASEVALQGSKKVESASPKQQSYAEAKGAAQPDFDDEVPF